MINPFESGLKLSAAEIVGRTDEIGSVAAPQAGAVRPQKPRTGSPAR